MPRTNEIASTTNNSNCTTTSAQRNRALVKRLREKTKSLEETIFDLEETLTATDETISELEYRKKIIEEDFKTERRLKNSMIFFLIDNGLYSAWKEYYENVYSNI